MGRWTLVTRITAAIVVISAACGLGIAAILSPDPSGLGTHQQLGLPPCSARLLLGIRCPACGMTTSWSHFMRGQWVQSIQANLAGFMLALYSAGAIGLGASVVWKGKVPSLRLQKYATITLIGIAIIAICQWGFRLATAAS